MLITEEKPVALNSLKFSDKSGNLIVDEGFMLTFGNNELAEIFIQKKHKYWQKILEMDLVIAPSLNETLHELEVVKVFKLTARHFNILYSNMMSKSRRRDYVEARRIAINICKFRHVQDSVISRATNIDHSTIVHHKKQFAKLIEYDKKLFTTYEAAEEFVCDKLKKES